MENTAVPSPLASRTEPSPSGLEDGVMSPLTLELVSCLIVVALLVKQRRGLHGLSS